MVSEKTRKERTALRLESEAKEGKSPFTNDKAPPDHLPPATYDFVYKPKKLTDAKIHLFLVNFADTGNFTHSAKSIEIHPNSIRAMMERSETFKNAVLLAKSQAVSLLEEECRRRAVEGVDEPQFYKGEEVATIKRYSDRLLEFLLMAHGGEKYAKLRKGGGSGDATPGGISIVIQNFGDGKVIETIETSSEKELKVEDAEYTEENTFESEDHTAIQVATPPVPDASVEVHGTGGKEGGAGLA